MKKYNICVVGAGGMGRAHTVTWKEIGMNVASIVDVDESRARDYATKYNIPKYYTDYKEAINDPEIDIVSVCTPVAFHAPVTIYAAEHNKHVLCEKPLARTEEEARAMDEAVKKAGVSCGVGLQRSRSKDVMLLQKKVEEGEFGFPLAVTVETLCPVRSKPAMHDANGNKGPIWDTGCHTYMMWQNILQSRVKTVFARGKTFAEGRPEVRGIKELAVDTVFIVMEYESGVILSYDLSWGLENDSQISEHLYRIMGPKGGAEVKPRQIVKIHHGRNVENIKIKDNSRVDTHQNFIDSVNAGKQPAISLQDGKDTLAVSLAVLESVQTGKAVDVKYF